MKNLHSNATDYIDAEFDGVAIKLKHWFIHQNPNVLDALNNLKTELLKAEFSLQEPNYVKSINELTDIEIKSKLIRERNKQREELRLKTNMEYENQNKKYLNFDEIKLEIKRFRDTATRCNDSLVVFENGDKYYLHQFLTKSDKLILNLKQRFEDECSTYAKMLEMSKRSPELFINIDEIIVHESLKNNLDIKLSVDVNGEVYVSYNSYYVIGYRQNKRKPDSLLYTSFLLYNQDGKLNSALFKQNNLNPDDYEWDLNTFKLIKNQSNNNGFKR